MTKSFTIEELDWAKQNGLIPAIIQDASSLRVLMLGYMNEEALRQTIKTGLVTFFSRSRQCLWQKGETSGHMLRLLDLRHDCDKDTLLIRALPAGPVCHTGTRTCFGEGDDWIDLAVLADLERTIESRRTAPPEESYTARLLQAGLARIAQKVGEEGVETALAAATKSPTLAPEAADLVYHLLVLLQASGLTLHDVLKVLDARARLKRSSS
ncbi:MAG: bifunctional phosphoribosyl-AMP cyclohydrolase/phosphoribosyl-ATP diphosphatase HisIE [Alphaproteobacteria bacterium]|nr:bifunctional phosphoribosyl-AMP cyclohydrolase/phosphoribosyl-ATP diphosphatase HisIE [Alphaproteobacteria bacterium]